MNPHRFEFETQQSAVAVLFNYRAVAFVALDLLEMHAFGILFQLVGDLSAFPRGADVAGIAGIERIDSLDRRCIYRKVIIAVISHRVSQVGEIDSG